MTERAEVLLEVIRIFEEYQTKKLLVSDIEARVRFELAKALAPGAIQEAKS